MVRDWLGRLLFLSVGLFAGALGVKLFQEEPRPPREVVRNTPPADPAAEAEVEKLRKQVADMKAARVREEQVLNDLRARLEEAHVEHDETHEELNPPNRTPLTKEEIDTELAAFGGELQGLFLGTNDKAKNRIASLMERDGAGFVKALEARFGDDSVDIGAKLAVAHALAQTGDPQAVETLAASLRDPDAGMMLHRLASHGLAFSDAEGSEPALLQAAHKHEDSGVRANASFGLARRDHPDGVKLYGRATDDAFAKGDPAALQYLSGFALLGEKAYPAVRERLLSYTDTQAVLVLINTIQTSQDKGAVEALRKLAYNSARPVSIQKAAQGALKALGTE